ncbi:MAG: mevalonate kinase [Sandaracinaceae bacterium]
MGSGEPALGRGKVILLGEHIVVYGVPALAAGISRGVRAWAQPAQSTSLTIAPWDVTVRPGEDADLARALDAVWPDGEPLAIEAEVELPAGAGLGCSAALGVAVVRAIARARGERPTDAEVAERAFLWEHVFHGNPSGIDNTMAAHGGIALYTRGRPLEPIAAKGTVRLVIGDSKEPSSTKAMVASVAHQRDRDPARFEKTKDAVHSLVKNAKLAIEAGDDGALGQLMDLNQHILSGLMLSTSRLEEMIAAARDAGALGAKLTGSGGGGCMIALAKDDTSAEAIRAAIEATGTPAFIAEAGR